MVPANNSRDVLELARRQLDFAAIASDAPSSKEILFKAQTMVPISPFKAWRRIAAAAGAGAVLAALLFVPWLPARSSASLVKLSFEQAVSHQQAYELISHFARELPRNVLLGAELSNPAEQQAADDGHLAIRLSSVSLSASHLSGIADELAASSDNPGLYQLLTGDINVTSWGSPVGKIGKLLNWRGGKTSKEAGDSLASSIFNHENVFAAGLAGQLTQLAHQLTRFGFITARQSTSTNYDFVINCWPADVGVSVLHYHDLMDSEQEAIRQRSAEFLETFNLRSEGLALIGEPKIWLPIVVNVYDRGGSYNPQLTSRLQSWIRQPEQLELASLDFDALDSVRQALERVIPNYDYRLDFVRTSGPSSNTARMYKVKVTVLGPRERTAEKMYIPAMQDDDAELEY